MLWLSCLAEVILFVESGHTGRERSKERRGQGGGGGGSEIEQNLITAGVNFAFSSMPNAFTICMQRRDKRDSNVSWNTCQRRVTKRTVAYRPAVSIRLSRSLGFPTCLFLASPLSGPHEWRPMASRKEQLSSLFFVAWTTQPLHEKPLIGFRRAKFSQRKTNRQKIFSVDDRFRGHHPRGS